LVIPIQVRGVQYEAKAWLHIAHNECYIQEDNIVEKRIYHYTSFEIFKLIIKNKVIRFNSLMNVDDAEEGYLTDCKSQAKYFFVSCWTEDQKENIPLWKMYVKSPFAIRIGVNPKILIPKLINRCLIENQKNRNAYVTLMHRKGNLEDNFISKVFYEKNPYLSQSKNLRGMYDPEYINKYGLIKNEDWSFQKEVRYIIQTVPIKSVIRRPDCSLYNSIQESIINNDFTNIEYTDMEYTQEFMENAHFMLGPSTTVENKQEFENFIYENVPNFDGEIARSRSFIRHNDI